MPLVHFSYRQSFEYDNTNEESDTIKMKVKLPLRARAASWKLKSFQITQLKRMARAVRYAEVLFPDLMVGNHVMYSLNSQVGTKTPDRALRFYMNRYSNDQHRNLALTNNASNLRGCVSKPDLDLGYHVLDNLELSMELTLRRGNASGQIYSPYSFSIILEYNE